MGLEPNHKGLAPGDKAIEAIEITKKKEPSKSHKALDYHGQKGVKVDGESQTPAAALPL